MPTNDLVIRNLGDKLDKYRSIINDLSNSASENLNPKKAKNLQKLLIDAENAYGKLKNAASDDFEDVKDAAHEVFDNLKDELKDISKMISADTLKEKGEDLVHYGQDKLDELEDRIAERPLAAVLLAFGAGLLLSNLLRGSK
ncbi:MAG: hypothetical protein BGO77_06510 [Caedibacter sp. 37-49]|nr:MAG: hypothetical protein BGO77_06510 [Caedibacter sp. 37-49]